MGRGLPRTRKPLIKRLERLSTRRELTRAVPTLFWPCRRFPSTLQEGLSLREDQTPLLQCLRWVSPRRAPPSLQPLLPGCHRNRPTRSGPASRRLTGPRPPPPGQPPAPDWSSGKRCGAPLYPPQSRGRGQRAGFAGAAVGQVGCP